MRGMSLLLAMAAMSAMSPDAGFNRNPSRYSYGRGPKPLPKVCPDLLMLNPPKGHKVDTAVFTFAPKNKREILTDVKHIVVTARYSYSNKKTMIRNREKLERDLKEFIWETDLQKLESIPGFVFER